MRAACSIVMRLKRRGYDPDAEEEATLLVWLHSGFTFPDQPLGSLAFSSPVSQLRMDM